MEDWAVVLGWWQQFFFDVQASEGVDANIYWVFLEMISGDWAPTLVLFRQSQRWDKKTN